MFGLASLKAKLIGAAVIVGAVLLFVWRIKARAYAAGRQDTITETWRKTIETVEKATSVRDRVDAAGDDELERLRNKYTRSGQRVPVDGNDLDGPG